MVILISGATHAGKTLYAQKILEAYGYPYLSIDHLKMGLIRSGHTDLTPMSDDAALTAYLWPIVREMVKTAVENEQNLVVEGCYIPSDWKKDFEEEYLQQIRHRCLIFSPEYIKSHWAEIIQYANAIEKRLQDDVSYEEVLEENLRLHKEAEAYGWDYVLIRDRYEIPLP